MEYIKVTNENIEKEHICCAISNNNDIQVSSKKAWLSERFKDGLVFLKSTERGKCFIEYETQNILIMWINKAGNSSSSGCFLLSLSQGI